MLVLLSFIITWGEVWYFDLKMIPLERRAREIWGREYREEEDEERRSLMGPSHNNGGMMERFMGGSTLYEGSVGNFYSPLSMSPANSDDEDDEDQVTGIRIPRKYKRHKDHPLSDKVLKTYFWQIKTNFSKLNIVMQFNFRFEMSYCSQEKEYKKMGEELLQKAYSTINTGEWKLVKKQENGDMVQVGRD